MPQDAELERLANAQDLAFQHRQEAYETMQGAWERRSSAREAMNRAFEVRQRAYDELDRTWKQYQNIRSANGPRIDSLNAQQETAYQNMKQSFESASAAFERRDGAAAKSHAAEGHRYKAEAQQCVTERRRLVEEIKSMRSLHEAARAEFERAKDAFQLAKRPYERSKAEHDRARAQFKKHKTEAEQAKDAFHKRLEQLKAQNKQRREDDRSIAIRADVPYEYLDNIKVRKNQDGSFDVFYGGAGQPDGFGHGHATLDRYGKASHDRRPFDSNSPENFADETSYIDFQRSHGHRGGYGLAHYGYINGGPVTFAFGWGSKNGHTLLADGHVDKRTFHHNGNHNHYGPGRGPKDNAMDRGRYTGLDA